RRLLAGRKPGPPFGPPFLAPAERTLSLDRLSRGVRRGRQGTRKLVSEPAAEARAELPSLTPRARVGFVIPEERAAQGVGRGDKCAGSAAVVSDYLNGP